MSERLTAMDVESQEFPRKLKGYGREEVRLFLRSVAEEIQRLNLENADLRAKCGMVERQVEEVRGRERTLQATLVSAQRMADEMKARSEREAGLLVKESRVKANRLLEQAQDQLARIEDEIRRARAERDAFETRLRSTVEEHLSLLDSHRRDRLDQDKLRFMHRRTGSEAG